MGIIGQLQKVDQGAYAIDPNWVMVGITAVAAFFIVWVLKDMKSAVKSLSDLVQLHDKDIAVLKEKTKEL